MDTNSADVIIAASALLALVAIVKLLADHVTTRRITGAHLSDEALHRLLDWTKEVARESTLKWGLTFAAIGVGLVVVDLSPLAPGSPAGIGVMIIAGSAGLLGYYALSRHDRGDRK